MPTQVDSNGAIVDSGPDGSGSSDAMPEVTVTGHATWWPVWVGAGVLLGWVLFSSGSRRTRR